MRGFAWLVAMILLPAAGAPLLLRAGFRRFAPVTRVILAGGAGAAFVSFTLTLFSLAGIAWRVAPVIGIAGLLAWGISPFGGREPASRTARVPLGGAGILAAALSAISVLAALAATLAGAATSIDLFLFWGPKAQQFALARGIDLAYLTDPTHAYMHAYYPPLVAGLGALTSMAAGHFSWTAATLTFPILLGALAIALPDVLGGAAARPAAWAASALAIGALAVLGIRACVAGSGDMPLVFFETLAMALLLRRDAGQRPVQLLAGLLLAAAAATKVEGLVFALAAAGLVALARGLGAAFRLLAPTAVTLAAWFAFGVSRQLFHVYSEYGSFSEVHLEHLPRAAAGVVSALAGAGRGLPYLVPLVCLLAAGRLSRAAWLPLGTAAALVLFLFFTYLHLADDPWDWIAWSAARVFMPVAALLALAPCAAQGRAQDTPAPSPR